MFQLFGISSEVYIAVMILAVLLFFFWRWAFRKCKVTKSSLYSVIASIIIAPLLYVVFVSCFILAQTYYADKTFDRNTWLNNREVRYEYTHSLKKQKLLEGKTKEQIKDYLGEPDLETTNTLTYYIGIKPSIIGIDYDWLEISFKDNVVSETREYKS